MLEPHLPIALNTRLVGRWWELMLIGAMALASLTQAAAMEAAPLRLLFGYWLVVLAWLLGRSVRLVVSPSLLRIGRRSWKVSDVRRVHFEVPGWLQQRGQRAVIVVEPKRGPSTRVKVPNAVAPVMRALQMVGVEVSSTRRRAWWEG